MALWFCLWAHPENGVVGWLVCFSYEPWHLLSLALTQLHASLEMSDEPVFLFKADGKASGWLRDSLLRKSWFLSCSRGPCFCAPVLGPPSCQRLLSGMDHGKVVIGEKFPSKFAGVGNKAYLCTRISEEGRLAQLV